MYEFYFFAIKKLLGILLLHSHYLLLVSVGQPKDSLANHSFALVSPFVVADGQALFGWSRNGVSRGGGPDSKDTSG